ncbi:hypothetical protein H632_c1826p0, partial [Helicosporidium sp. ATCC 50920]
MSDTTRFKSEDAATPENVAFANIILQNAKKILGRSLPGINESGSEEDKAREMYEAPYPILAHKRLKKIEMKLCASLRKRDTLKITKAGVGRSRGADSELPMPRLLPFNLMMVHRLGMQLCSTVALITMHRLLIMESVRSLPELLLTISNGLTIARWTERTLVLGSLQDVYNISMPLGQVLNITALSKFWPCFVETDALRASAGGPACIQSDRACEFEASALAPALERVQETLDRAGFAARPWEEGAPGDLDIQAATWAPSSALGVALYRHVGAGLCVGDAVWEEAFWRSVVFSDRVLREAKKVLTEAFGSDAGA